MTADYDKLFKPLDAEPDVPSRDQSAYFVDDAAAAHPPGFPGAGDHPPASDDSRHRDEMAAASGFGGAVRGGAEIAPQPNATATHPSGGALAIDAASPPGAARRHPPTRPWPIAPASGAHAESAAGAAAADVLHRPVIPPSQAESQTDGRTEIVLAWTGAEMSHGAERSSALLRQPAHAPPESEGYGDGRTRIVNRWPMSEGTPAQPEPMSALVPGRPRVVDGLSKVGVKASVKMPSQRGWRHILYLLTRINLGLAPDEMYEIDLHTRIRRNARDSYQIGVFGLKGGVGKTAVTVALGSALSSVRGDRILAVDADPDGGNLADRCGRESAATIADLLADRNLTRYNDIRSYTSVNRANLEVLSSDDYSAARRPFGPQEWNGVANIVSRYYNLVLADCGAGLFHPAARSVLNTVSGLVIVASASIDGARQAAVTMDWLRQNGYQHLLGRTCVVINHISPGKPNLDVADLIQQFESHLAPGRVIELPWDKHIAAGTTIDLDLLSPTFRRRTIELAAALSDDFERMERR